MSDQFILKLAKLRGTLRAKQTFAKGGIYACHATMKHECSQWAHGYLTGEMKVYVEMDRHLQHCINELSQIIKEANNA